MEKQDKPTQKFYGLFQYVFDHYNEQLFNATIKNLIIVITRKKNVAGHYSHNRWVNVKDNKTDELALNPGMFLKFPLLEIGQTIVHEMCHAWQFHYGKPSYRGYHNKEWAGKMIEVGLMPTDTGKPGGKTTGFKIADYPIEGGRFLQGSEELINNKVFEELYYQINPGVFQHIDEALPLFDQIKDLVATDLPQPKTNKYKVKYSCSCSNVWGKPDLEIHCNACGEDMEAT